ncbi:MAG: DUF4405 domain-containing protein [Lachnospiraceae bacterium]|nr:DUF4405 domain-containing protein [Lachnospiraceae bacterium]
MRAKIKIVIDAGMIILVLLQMAYHLIGDSLHEWLGIMLFVLLILHNILDRKWYSGLFKGKYTQIRFFHTAINMLLLASFLCVTVSAVFLSTTLSTLFNLKLALLGRRMHMIFTTWSFIFMSVHVGLHWSRRIGAIKKQSQGVQYLFWIMVILLSGYGVYAFISRGLLQRMFFLSEYVFFDYEESFIFIIIDYIAILCLFTYFTYGVSKLITKQK